MPDCCQRVVALRCSVEGLVSAQPVGAIALAQTGASGGLEPARLAGEFGRFAAIGVMAFLIVFSGLLFLSYRRVWRDAH